MHRHQVVIVGGGPVGMGLAIDLGQRGIDTLVVERETSLHTIPKGQNLTQRTGEHFRAWGISEAIRAARLIPASFGAKGFTAYGSLLSAYHYPWLNRASVREFYAADNERLPQYEAEKVLRARAAELPSVTVRYGVEALALEQGSDSATVQLVDPEGAAQVVADYVVGCDGSRSIIRDGAGIDQEVSAHDKRMCLLVFRSTALHELLQRYPGISYFNALHPRFEGYWQFLGRVDPAETWFFHAPVPRDATREDFDFKALLHQAVGEVFPLDFDYVGFWDLRIAIARTYQAGRVFIAGDAAHSHPPYGGFGVNSGFEDARNLGWKLAAALAGWAGRDLLASYSAERQPVFASTARDFIERMIEDDRDFLSHHDPDVDQAAFEAAWASRSDQSQADVTGFAPHYSGSPVVVGGDGQSGAVGSHDHRARAGHHLSPRMTDDGRSSDQRLGDGFTLVAIDARDSEVDEIVTAAAGLDLPLGLLRTAETEATAAWQARLILVRPDGFIAFAGNTLPTTARDVLQRAAGYPA